MRVRYRRSWAWLFIGLGVFSAVWVTWLMFTTLENILVVQLFVSVIPVVVGILMLNRPYFYYHPHDNQIIMAGLGFVAYKYPQLTCRCQRLDIVNGRIVLVYLDGEVEKTPIASTMANPEDFKRFTDQLGRKQNAENADYRSHDRWIERVVGNDG
ncbi:hypothetical protein [Haloglycomyces albus]|uniref:hypothetical protein n=1 Tax=Haloglycomyces albus TaxID=526067 RepID=UPI00046CD6F5|nr:hypothetical protein [Haloglycomyces albus]